MVSAPVPPGSEPSVNAFSRPSLEDTAHGHSPTVFKHSALEPTSATVSRVLRPPVHLNVAHSIGTRIVKGEDMLFIQNLTMEAAEGGPPSPGQPPSQIFMVCDGHSGVGAAKFVSDHFLRLLSTKLPTRLPNFGDFKDIEGFAESVRKAICQTFFHLDNEWAAARQHSGTTVTVALVTGWLVTVANVGDSSAVIDTGCSVLELTKSHRLHDSVEEQARLKAAACQLAPLGFHLEGPAKTHEIGVGPLRLWPGGLCVARSVGDLDCGPEVVPLPNIRQVIMPPSGCRIIMASDGLWDCMSLGRACSATRLHAGPEAVTTLMGMVLRDLRMMDDTTLVVLDLLPKENVGGWPSAVLRADPRAAQKAGGGGFCGCFRPEMEESDSRDVVGAGHLTYFADVDTLKAYPGLKALLQRTLMFDPHAHHVAPKDGADFTQHGAALAWRPGNSVPPGSASTSTHRLLDHHSGVGAGGMSKVGSSPNLQRLTLGQEGGVAEEGGSRRSSGSRGGSGVETGRPGSGAHGSFLAAAALRLVRMDSGGDHSGKSGSGRMGARQGVDAVAVR